MGARTPGQVPLSRHEFDLLLYLARRPGQVVSCEELFRELWKGHPRLFQTAVLRNAVKRLRAKLSDSPNAPCYIQTVRGCGYRAAGPESGEDTPN